MLSIRNLVKVYPGPVTALQGVDLDVATGMFGLLGPNGAGKSTLMKIVAGLLEPTSGEVTLDAVDVVRNPEAVRPHLGYLPQDFGFYPHLTGESMLLFLLKLKGVDAAQGQKRLVADLLERVNLAFAAKRKVKGYSGGMRQRLGIAQAIAGNPKLIIVDEPTAGLDPEERHRFYRLLGELAQDRTVLLSTHIVEDVSTLCPRFAVIRDGKLVALTSPTEARASIAGAIFEGTVDAVELTQLKRTRRVTQAILYEGRNRVRIHEPNGTPPPGFEPVKETLEDAYLVLMQGAARAVSNGASGNDGKFNRLSAVGEVRP
ncbi:MAG: ABC transporter ATP-binding protein [Planctomycetes bacterium]|nr:ABC transporter ATP-binding protein [Planctomycetota bacterium]MBI3845423.1 ABC transporter ATP-binding protein [Planctomycetota bacterium]